MIILNISYDTEVCIIQAIYSEKSSKVAAVITDFFFLCKCSSLS